MIIYFNHDEGGQMDILWSYYSGEKRDSFQWDSDYGLEQLYIADIAHLFSAFMRFTPGTLALILRWIHSIAWILSFLALRYFIKYHFGSRWQALSVILLLSVRPAYAYLLTNFKPEPLVLLLMIIGLHYILRILDEPSKKNLVIAISISVLAFLIKFSGIFLIPAIIASMYIANHFNREDKKSKIIFPNYKISWIFPSLIGFGIILFTVIFLLFYVRKSTGFSWFKQFGFLGSLSENRMILYVISVGFLFILISVLLYFLHKKHFLEKIFMRISEINSHALTVCGLFLILTLIFGFRWIISPQYFILTYAQFGPVTLNTSEIVGLNRTNFINIFLNNIKDKLNSFDPIILLLLLVYIVMEIKYKQTSLKDSPRLFAKRIVLAVYLVAPFIFAFSMLKFCKHHLFPFFIAMSILSVQGLYLFNRNFKERIYVKRIVVGLIASILIFDIAINGKMLIESRIYRFRQQEDIVFELAKWWRENIPLDATVVADHFIHVYIPPEYKNIKTTTWTLERIDNFRHLVDSYKPRFIYYNARQDGPISFPPVDKLLPGKKTRLVKCFDSEGRRFQRKVGDKFLIYEIISY